MMDRCFQLLFTGIALCLALTFFLRIFAPGNPDTAWLFQGIHPLQQWLDLACGYLTLPLDRAFELLNSIASWMFQWIPAEIKRLFPVMPAEVAARDITSWMLLLPHDPHGQYARDLTHARYDLLFPGVIDWRLLLALPFWNWVDSLCIQLIQWLEMAGYRHHLRQENKKMVKTIRAQETA